MHKKLLSSVLAVAWGLMSSRAAMALPAQEPLFLVPQVSPMVMLAMSVDHQLFAKAFADYSDLNGDGVIDNSYVDTFSYYGYFDSNRCYAYNSSSGYFEPKDAAGGTNSHHCSGAASNGDWSGNFLNWATMTRVDVLRKALFGGKRAVDSASQTVLERALLANDVHSFAKVFTPAAGDSTQNYTPYSVTTMTLCNSTPAPSGGPDVTQSMSTVTNPPKVRIANGDWGRWASGERHQCEWNEDTNSDNALTTPAYADNLFAATTKDAPSVKVDVCVANKLEANCRSYNGTDSKPIGLLQEYGEDGTLRFGMVSGSYENRDRGGVLRKAVGLFAGNTTASDDEVNLTDGTFNTSLNGIISTLNAVRLNTWDYGSTQYNDCNTYGIPVSNYLSRTPYVRDGNTYNVQCSNWGNPVSELYLEAVRYMMGEGSATSAFDVTSDALGLPSAAWNDPMPASEYCTPMNVVVVSSGDNNFDTDDLTNVPSVLGSWTAATDAVGAEEVSQGTIGSSVFIGEVGGTPLSNPDTNICSAETFTSLSEMRGLCPTSPNKQGGYAIAGIAHKAHTVDLRNDRQDDQHINTYTIAMSKTLPDFVIPLGSGAMTLIPIAYAGPKTSTPPAGANGWKSSSLAQLNIENQVYDANNNLTYVRFLAQWEDSAWGSDYDMDMVSRVSVCVGAECTNHDDDGDGTNDTSPGADTARVTVRMMHAAGSVSMNVGFIVAGTTADGAYAGVIKNHGGGKPPNFTSFDDDPGRDGNEPAALAVTFTAGTSTAKNLPLPLELAAKYGSFQDSNNNDLPDVQSEWDGDGDGKVDTFFFADDPSQIGPRLSSYLATIATTSSSASVVANTVSLRTTTRIYQARFDSDDWSGSVLSFPVDPVTGALQPAEWDVASILATQDHETGREIITWDPTANSNAGGGIPFRWNSLNVNQKTALSLNPGSGLPDLLGSDRLDYLRGDDSKELANGGTFRDRATPLGDVVNSSPTVVGAPSFGYPDSMEPTAKYSDFVAAYDDVECYLPGVVQTPANLRPVSQLEREPILYFSGNDGALHGVSACTGQERIAYVPNSVYEKTVSGLPTPNLSKLTSSTYQHQYFVDGPVTVVDAFWSGAWHTVLVGTLGGGGKGVFALDVTDPGKFDEVYAGQLALWDIEATPGIAGSPYEELGYTYSQPSVVKVDGLGWVAIFGNGYHGKSGKAIMYVVRINDGQLLQTIDLSATGPGSTSHGTGNGLSTVAPVDTDGDGDADIVYGGDLNGNLWRFAKSGLVGFTRANTTLLYTAKSQTLVSAGVYERQPITSRMAVGYHPTSAIGRIVFFGTGKYYESTDQNPANAVTYNTMYGIWDRDDGATITSVTTRNSNILQQQTITNTQVTTFGSNTETIRLVSNTPVQWAGFSPPIAQGAPPIPETCAVNKSCGWYLDLTDSGEKMVAEPILRAGKLIFVTTIPSSVACDAGGSGWLMEVNPNTGGRLDVPVLDLNGDGVFDFLDMPSFTSGGVTTYTPVTGVKSKVGIIQAPAILAGVGGPQGGCTNCESKYFSGSKQGQIDVKTENALGAGEGRKSWVRFDN